MPEAHSDAVRFNQLAWDKLASAGDKFYRAMTPEQIQSARDGRWKIRVTPTKEVPKDWLMPVANKKILCLAGGGGQQAPILAAAGADVTVFDLSNKQLERDREVSQREGLSIKLVAGDMRDLSAFSNDQFDLVVSPCATCFCPSVGEIWNETFRILKPGGSFVVGFINPAYYLFDAKKMDQNKLVVRHPIPYSDDDLPKEERAVLLGPERPIEFGHSLNDLIGLQIEAGFYLDGIFEDSWGDNDKLSQFIDLFIATRATKPL